MRLFRPIILLSLAVALSACGSENSDPAMTSPAASESSSTQASSADRVSRPGEYAGYSEEVYNGYELTSRYIPMRDETDIAIDIFRPTLDGEVATEPLPVLWMHTPYNRRNYGGGLTAENYPGKALKLANHGYIVAIADFRGLYASYGTNAGYNRGEWQDAARWDAYDITEWLAAQEWSSGEIGMWGCSATGGSQMQALTTAPPSLKAVFPMSCEWDVYPFAVFGGMSPPEGEPSRLARGGARAMRDARAVPVDGDENGELLAAAIAEHEDNIETAGHTPFRDSVSENFGSQWWLKSSPHTYADAINESDIAVYSAMNLDEEGPGYGPAFTFNNITNPRKFIVGPATHCDWTEVEELTGFDILVEELRFFDYWLKGIDNGIMDEAPVTYYTYNLEENNGWRTAQSWPLPNERRQEFLLSDSGLAMGNNGSAETTVTVDYDVNNENFWDKGVTFMTEPLEQDMQVTGHSVVKLFVSSTATDADVVARIDDIAPDGTQTYHTVEGRLRASLRKQEEAPYNNLGLPWHPFTEDSAEPLVPGEPVEVEFDLYAMSTIFREGHQIRLTLNFADQRATPKMDPPPQVTVHHSEEYPSALVLPVIDQDN